MSKRTFTNLDGNSVDLVVNECERPVEINYRNQCRRRGPPSKFEPKNPWIPAPGLSTRTTVEPRSNRKTDRTLKTCYDLVFGKPTATIVPRRRDYCVYDDNAYDYMRSGNVYDGVVLTNGRYEPVAPGTLGYIVDDVGNMSDRMKAINDNFCDVLSALETHNKIVENRDEMLNLYANKVEFMSKALSNMNEDIENLCTKVSAQCSRQWEDLVDEDYEKQKGIIEDTAKIQGFIDKLSGVIDDRRKENRQRRETSTSTESLKKLVKINQQFQDILEYAINGVFKDDINGSVPQSTRRPSFDYERRFPSNGIDERLSKLQDAGSDFVDTTEDIRQRMRAKDKKISDLMKLCDNMFQHSNQLRQDQEELRNMLKRLDPKQRNGSSNGNTSRRPSPRDDERTQKYVSTNYDELSSQNFSTSTPNRKNKSGPSVSSRSKGRALNLSLSEDDLVEGPLSDMSKQ